MLNYKAENTNGLIRIHWIAELPGETLSFEDTFIGIHAAIRYLESCKKDIFTRWFEHLIKKLAIIPGFDPNVYTRASNALIYFIQNGQAGAIKKYWPEIEKDIIHAVPDDQPEIIGMINQINDFVKEEIILKS